MGYYAKNPQGVQVQSNTSTFPRTRAQSYHTLNTSADFERQVHSQPYRTSPLVTCTSYLLHHFLPAPPWPQYERPKPNVQQNPAEARVATEAFVEPSGLTTRAVSSSPRQQRQVMGRPIVTSSSLSRSGSINQSKSFKKVMADLEPIGTDM